jgi:hypothetical protein
MRFKTDTITEVPADQLAGVMRDEVSSVPPPTNVTSSPDGKGTFTVTVYFAVDTPEGQQAPEGLQAPDGPQVPGDQQGAGGPAGQQLPGGQQSPTSLQIAWGGVVSAAFKGRIIDISDALGCDPSYLMAAMAFETGESFSPSVINRTSGATGLVQFMPSTARSLGTTSSALAAMTAEAQLGFVQKYLQPFRGRMKSLSDVYMTILFPAAVGKPDAFVLFSNPSIAYEQNAGLDVNHDGHITKGEAASKVQAELDKGLGGARRG